MNTVDSVDKLYGIFDKLAGRYVQFFSRPSDALAVRDSLYTLRFSLNDSELICFGDIKLTVPTDVEDIHAPEVTFFTSSLPRLVPWDSYKFPETVGEALAPLGLSDEEIKEISKAKIEQIEPSR